MSVAGKADFFQTGDFGLPSKPMSLSMTGHHPVHI